MLVCDKCKKKAVDTATFLEQKFDLCQKHKDEVISFLSSDTEKGSWLFRRRKGTVKAV